MVSIDIMIDDSLISILNSKNMPEWKNAKARCVQQMTEEYEFDIKITYLT